MLILRPTTRMLTAAEYRGVGVEVCHPHDEISAEDRSRFDHATRFGWCGYVYLWLDRFADAELRESLWPDPEPTGITARSWTRHPDWLYDLDFHGGVTFFEKRLGYGGERGVKVGCDYRHAWDCDEAHNDRSVLLDMCRCVDRLHEKTTYLMSCGGDGRLATESEGIVPDGWERWVSLAYIDAEIAAGRWLNHHTRDGKQVTSC